MTVSTVNNQIDETGSGTTNEVFTVNLRIIDPSHLIVLEDGTVTVQDTDYTVTSYGGAQTTVTWIGATSAVTYSFVRIVPASQAADYLTEGRFPAETHEQGLDLLTMLAQQSLRLNTTDGQTYDGSQATSPAANKRIANIADGTDAQDVVTLSQLQAQTFESGGTLPTPSDPDDDGKHLEAFGGSYVLATHSEVPVPDNPGDDDKVLTASGGAFTFEDPAVVAAPYPNAIINGDFRIAQRGTSFTAATTPANSDDTYLLDRWVLLSDGNDVVDVSQDTGVVPNGASAACKFLWATANKQAALLTILEHADTQQLLQDGASSTVSLSFKARTTTGAVIGTIRAAVISWTSTADSPTSDAIGTWAGGGTDPTLATNWEYENTPSDLSVTVDSYGTHTIEGITVSNSPKNIAVLIWVDDTTIATGDVLYIADVRLEPASVAHDFLPRPSALERSLCERYFFALVAGAAGDMFGAGSAQSATVFNLPIRLPAEMLTTPSMTVRSAVSDFAGYITTAQACTSIAANEATPRTIYLRCTSATLGASAGLAVVLQSVNANAQLWFDAEL